MFIPDQKLAPTTEVVDVHTREVGKQWFVQKKGQNNDPFCKSLKAMFKTWEIRV